MSLRHQSWLEQLDQLMPTSPHNRAFDSDDPRWQAIEGALLQLESPYWCSAHADKLLPTLKQLVIESPHQIPRSALLRVLTLSSEPEDWQLAVQLLIRWLQGTEASQHWLQPGKKAFLIALLKRLELSRTQLPAELKWQAQWQALRQLLPEDCRGGDDCLPQTAIDAAEQPAPTHREATDNTIMSRLVESQAQQKDVQLQQALLLTQHHPGQPIGYRLRRHAIWSHIQNLPEHDARGRTALWAPTPDQCRDYQTEPASIDRLLTLELSLEQAPFWLHGHYLAAQLASEIGFNAVADAIRDELMQFLTRLAGVRCLTFQDGRPLLQRESEQWLTPSAPLAASECWHQLNEQELLPCLERQLAQGLQRREQDLILLQFLEHSREAFPNVTQHLSRLLHTQLQQQPLESWEPHIFERLNRLVYRSESDKEAR